MPMAPSQDYYPPKFRLLKDYYHTNAMLYTTIPARDRARGPITSLHNPTGFFANDRRLTALA